MFDPKQFITHEEMHQVLDETSLAGFQPAR
jgi:hypothetical protein